MIYLNDKIGNINYVNGQNISQTLLPKNKDRFDSIHFSSKTDKKNNKDRNKLIAYLIGGAVIITGAILLIMQYRKGKTPVKTVKDIKEAAKSGNNSHVGTVEGKKEAPSSNSSSHHSSTPSGKSYSSSSMPSPPPPPSHSAEFNKVSTELGAKDKELERLAAQKKALEQQVEQTSQGANERGDLKKQVEELKRKSLELRINQFIKVMAPKDESIVREVFPKLEEYSDRLGIITGDKDQLAHYRALNDYVKQITPENKDFAINEGIQLIAENMEKIRAIVKDPENSHKLLGALNTKNKDFAFNEVMPLIIENNSKLKLQSISQLSTILEHLTPETKDAIKIVADNADKLQLDDLSVAYLLAAVTPQNKKAITVLADNAKKFELNSFFADDFKKLLDSGEGGILKEASKS